MTTAIDDVSGAVPPRESWPEPLPHTDEGRLLTELIVTTVTTSRTVSVTATITVDRSPYWTRTWSRCLGPDRPEGA